MKSLDELLQACAALHHHLCPRQVLGVRMGMLAGQVLGLDLPQSDKRLLTIAETDGCGADGIAVATGCWVGRRTMRVEDYGKVAATFVDTDTSQTVRIAPRVEARQIAFEYAPEAHGRWETQLLGYQRMPAKALLSVQPVHLNVPVEQLISRASRRVTCERCGEEIMNEREVVHEGVVLCKSCAGPSYYSAVAEFNAPVVLLNEQSKF
jgi:formylmethanofuran dehydrogenase subunit E